MLKGEKISTPYFNLAATSFKDNLFSIGSQADSSTISASSSGITHACSSSSGGAGGGVRETSNATNHQQKVTRRRVHEICEKRKQEEQESESHKKVKTEGDASESLIRELVKQVESEQANVQNDVSDRIRP